MRRCAVLLLLGVATPTAHAADLSGPFAQYEWLHRGDDGLSESIDEPLLALSPERRIALEEAGYGFVDLLWRSELTIRAGGEISQRFIIIRHFLSLAGIQEAGDFSQRIQSARTDLFIDRALVRSPDGRHTDLDLENVQVVTDPSPSVFSDRFLVVVPFEGLVPGATAVLITRQLSRSKQWPLPWSQILYTRWWVPVERVEMSVQWDADEEEPSWTTNDDHLVCERPSRQELHCLVEEVAALPRDPDVRSQFDPAPYLIVAEAQSWSDLAMTVEGLLARSRSRAAGVDQLSESLMRNASTPQERIQRIHRYVTDEIRYVGLGHGLAAIEPAAVEQTLARRFGDCKGKVALFLELAERAGVDAWGVLVGTEHFDLAAIVSPSMQFFDHMIACYRFDPRGGSQCVDLTEPNAGTGQLPPSLIGAVALDLQLGTEAPRSLDAPEYPWSFEVETTNRLGCDGGLTEELNRQFSGSGSIPIRALLNGMPVQERRRWAEESYKGVIDVGAVSTIGVEGLEDPLNDVSVRTETRFPGAHLQEIPEYREPDAWLHHFAKWFMTENQHHPYRLDGTRVRTLSKYEFCPGRRVKFTGANLRFESEFGSLRRFYTKDAESVLVQTVLEMPRATIAVDQLPRYRRFLERSLAQSDIWYSFDQ